LERVIVITVIAIFMAMFVNRADRVDAQLERATLELVIQDLQSRVLMFTAEQRAVDRVRELVEYIGKNPVGTITSEIGNYAGDPETIDWTGVKPGQWVFDRGSGNLVYRVINEDYVDTELSDPKRIRYRLDAHYSDRNANERFDRDADIFISLKLTAIDQDPWIIGK